MGARPWPADRWPTPEEWLDWLLTAPREEQLRAAARALEASQEAMECFTRNHIGRLADETATVALDAAGSRARHCADRGDRMSDETGRSDETERVDRCPTCRAADVDWVHANRCKLLDHTSAAAVKHGREAIAGPIHGQKSRDLWAHINTRIADPEAARDLVVKVIDLGWRPVVGKYDLWSPNTPPESSGPEGHRDVTTPERGDQ